MSELIVGKQRFRDDDGSADPAARSALAAYAAGRAGEDEALTALAGARLLMPLVAVPVTAAGHEHAGHEHAGHEHAGHEHAGHEHAGHASGAPGPGGQKSEMAVPTLVGRDGRHAVLAFTCLDALTRWRPDARPVPVPADEVWQAGTQDASAVVIDVAGPVPIVADGVRLAALAAGGTVPAAHEDPDLLAHARSAVAGGAVIAGVALLPGTGHSDLRLHLTIAAGLVAGERDVQAAVERVATAVMEATAGRLRRGIEVAVTESGP